MLKTPKDVTEKVTLAEVVVSFILVLMAIPFAAYFTLVVMSFAASPKAHAEIFTHPTGIGLDHTFSDVGFQNLSGDGIWQYDDVAQTITVQGTLVRPSDGQEFSVDALYGNVFADGLAENMFHGYYLGGGVDSFAILTNKTTGESESVGLVYNGLGAYITWNSGAGTAESWTEESDIQYQIGSAVQFLEQDSCVATEEEFSGVVERASSLESAANYYSQKADRKESDALYYKNLATQREEAAQYYRAKVIELENYIRSKN